MPNFQKLILSLIFGCFISTLSIASNDESTLSITLDTHAQDATYEFYAITTLDKYVELVGKDQNPRSINVKNPPAKKVPWYVCCATEVAFPEPGFKIAMVRRIGVRDNFYLVTEKGLQNLNSTKNINLDQFFFEKKPAKSKEIYDFRGLDNDIDDSEDFYVRGTRVDASDYDLTSTEGRENFLKAFI